MVTYAFIGVLAILVFLCFPHAVGLGGRRGR
jgi:hypothetical protein